MDAGRDLQRAWRETPDLVQLLKQGLVYAHRSIGEHAVLGKILVLVFIILFIQKRPRGLFALKGRSVEG